MGIFDIEKDIKQIKETGKEIKETGKKIKEKAPLVISVGKSTFVIIKWLIVTGVIFSIIFGILVGILVYIEDLQHRKKLERQSDCSDSCNYSLKSCNEILGKHSFEKYGFSDWWDEKCPNTPEEKECFNNCLK